MGACFISQKRERRKKNIKKITIILLLLVFTSFASLSAASIVIHADTDLGGAQSDTGDVYHKDTGVLTVAVQGHAILFDLSDYTITMPEMDAESFLFQVDVTVFNQTENDALYEVYISFFDNTMAYLGYLELYTFDGVFPHDYISGPMKCKDFQFEVDIDALLLITDTEDIAHFALSSNKTGDTGNFQMDYYIYAPDESYPHLLITEIITIFDTAGETLTSFFLIVVQALTAIETAVAASVFLQIAVGLMLIGLVFLVLGKIIAFVKKFGGK